MTPQRVLVVDDEPMVLEVLSRYLRSDGFEVATAADGREALVRFGESEPDLVLLDLMLPHIDGYEVFRQLRERASTPVIMLTARGEEIDRIVGLDGGADDYIGKPFSPREVVARVRAVLRRAGPAEVPSVLEIGRIRIDSDRRETTVAGDAGGADSQGVRPAAAFGVAPGDHLYACAAVGGRLGLRLVGRHIDGHRARSPAAREDRGDAFGTGASVDGLGRGLPVRAVSQFVRTVLVLLGVAAASVAGALLVGVALGMASETAHVAVLLVPAAVVTVAAAYIAPRALAGATLASRLAAVAIVAIVVALANLAVLAMDMVVGGEDARLLAILLVYALGAGVTVAVSLARTLGPPLRRLRRTAIELGAGDLDARVGELTGGPELDALARTLDEMAERLQRTEAHRAEIAAMRRDLITAVSHDLRTPLASLRAMVEAIDDGVVDDPPTLARYAAEMRGSVVQLSTMVDDLFEFTQLDAGAIERETKRARLEEVVGSAMATVEPHVAAKGLAVEADLSAAAGVSCSPRMTRVFQNLLMNAVRHTPADGVVRLSARREGALLQVSVEDTGTGIPPADLDRIFEPFYRADPARSGPGAGLGLALAKRIVEALGGRITAANAISRGARFAVTLPIAARD